jgi:hypothetical protein
MNNEASKFSAGTASFALAVIMLCVHVLLLVLAQIPPAHLSGLLGAIGPTIGLASCFAIIAIPLSLILGKVGVTRGGGQRRWGWLGLALTAHSILVGYLAQAASWRQ